MIRPKLTFCRLIHVLFLLSFCLKSYSKDENYVFEAISPHTGFVFNGITSVLSDSKGLVWFGTDDGLYYYNTKEFKKYNTVKHNLPSNKINKLYHGYGDIVWICTDKGICYFDSKNDKFVTIGNNTGYSSHIIQLADNMFLAVIGGELFEYDKNENRFSSLELPRTRDAYKITCLDKSPEGKVFVGCDNGKLFVANSNSLKFTLIYDKLVTPIKSVCTSNDIVYIGYELSGVTVIDKSSVVLKRFDQTNTGDSYLPDNKVRKIIQRKNGDIWIGTYNGILVITNNGNRVIKTNSFNSLPRNSVYDIYVDEYDALWLGTWSGGLAYYNQNNYKFKKISQNDDRKPNVRSPHFANENKNEIWIGSEDSGLMLYDISNNTQSKQIDYELRVKSLAKDESGTLWIGTVDKGLHKLSKGDNTITSINIPDINNNKCLISVIAPDKNILWLGTRGHGIVQYDKLTKQSDRFIMMKDSSESADFNMIWDIKVIDDKHIAVCSDGGFGIFSKKDKKFKHYKINNNTTRVYIMFMLDNENIYIGTRGEGVLIFNTKNGKFTPFEQNDKIKDFEIYSIIEDKKKNLWLSSNNGIYCYDRSINYLKHFSTEDNLFGKQFHPHSGAITDKGIIIFGGTSGINFINIADITINPVRPKAFLSKLLINNNLLDSTHIKYVNSKHIPDISEIELAYDKNSLIFEFASNNFMKSKSNLFRYRLINYQNRWIEISNDENITFTKLPYGKYILEVLCSNNDGVWSEEPKRIYITITPPLWLRWYAIVIYFGIILIIIYIISKEVIFRMKMQKEVNMERYKNQINQRTFDEKLKFFMNISHELRTPLSLILSPLNIIDNQNTDTNTLRFHLRTIRRNASRMLRLTNQILDFRVLEVGLMRLQRQLVDIIAMCKTMCECFDFHVEENDIKFSFTHPKSTLTAIVDEKMIDKIIYNLLSNAMKFSGEGQTVSLSVSQTIVEESGNDGYFVTGTIFSGKALNITVFNTGEPIATDRIGLIFNRFYFDENNINSGSGIGLHLCLEYTRMHGGHIMVKSDENGTEFIVNIPLNTETENKSDIVTEIISDHSSDKQDIEIPDSNNKNAVVMIVDDNDEIRFYLKSILSHNYKCVTAKNGAQGIEIIENILPDIIIMDVLMPRMNGIECLTKLRENHRTSWIPVILITASGNDSYQLSGINSGANAFISKPINEPLLFAHIERLINQYRENKALSESVIGTKKNEFYQQKENFLDTVQNIIENNIQNEHFDSEALCNILNISRSSLYRRIKSETNQSITEFIRDYRLKVAVKLMSNNKYNIDEIAFIVGFNSTSYFCRSFKAKYGKTPKDFFKNQNAEK